MYKVKFVKNDYWDAKIDPGVRDLDSRVEDLSLQKWIDENPNIRIISVIQKFDYLSHMLGIDKFFVDGYVVIYETQ